MEHGNNLQPAHYVVRNICTLFSDCFNILHRGAVLLEEYICRVNMGKLGQLRVNITKQGQIRGKYG